MQTISIDISLDMNDSQIVKIAREKLLRELNQSNSSAIKISDLQFFGIRPASDEFMRMTLDKIVGHYIVIGAIVSKINEGTEDVDLLINTSISAFTNEASPELLCLLARLIDLTCKRNGITFPLPSAKMLAREVGDFLCS